MKTYQNISAGPLCYQLPDERAINVVSVGGKFELTDEQAPLIIGPQIAPDRVREVAPSTFPPDEPPQTESAPGAPVEGAAEAPPSADAAVPSKPARAAK